IEDAYVLGRALAASHVVALDGDDGDDDDSSSFFQRNSGNVEEALRVYYQQRLLRVAAVSFLSRLASDLIVNAFDTPWSPHDRQQWNWRSYLTFAWKPVLQYLIFPAQFLFLYSFAPTGPMGDLPKKLEADWRQRHAALSALYEQINMPAVKKILEVLRNADDDVQGLANFNFH
ncbi:MAG: hypothetical protein AAFV49_23965, partial [Pseudomonadota bacterium]